MMRYCLWRPSVVKLALKHWIKVVGTCVTSSYDLQIAPNIFPEIALANTCLGYGVDSQITFLRCRSSNCCKYFIEDCRISMKNFYILIRDPIYYWYCSGTFYFKYEIQALGLIWEKILIWKNPSCILAYAKFLSSKNCC